MTKQAGFSLMELMIYLVIVGIILAVGIPMYQGYIARAKVQTAKSDLRLFKQSILIYSNEAGKYPQKLEDLINRPSDPEVARKVPSALIDKSSVKLIDGKIVDPWGEPYHYAQTRGGKRQYELYSNGNPDDDNPVKIDAWEV